MVLERGRSLIRILLGPCCLAEVPKCDLEDVFKDSDYVKHFAQFGWPSELALRC